MRQFVPENFLSQDETRMITCSISRFDTDKCDIPTKKGVLLLPLHQPLTNGKCLREFYNSGTNSRGTNVREGVTGTLGVSGKE